MQRDEAALLIEPFLPLAGSSCRIVLTFSDKKIVAIEPGPAFDAAEWERVSEEIEKSIFAGPLKVGREYSFSSFRVPGWWRGDRSGVQILPPPDDAPRAHVEMAEHPYQAYSCRVREENTISCLLYSIRP